MRLICGQWAGSLAPNTRIKSSNGLIRVRQKIVLRSSLKQNYGFPSQVRRVNFTAVLILSISVKPTSLDSAVSCLLVDNLTQPLPGWGTFCRRNAADNYSCVHFKWKRIPGKASFVFKKDFRRLKIGSGTHEKEQRNAEDPRIHLWSCGAIRLLWWNLSNLKWGAVSNCFLPLINSKDSANMKNKNLNFSPKRLQTSPGSPQMMTNTTMK